MRINHNIGALNTYRQLENNSAAGQKSIEKLSSGLRINRAGDDAAGLAISEKMRAQIRGLDQASRNAQDGISMIQTTEGALNETHSILQRMRELANQSASDTNVGVDRAEIQKEMNQLTSEINRIGNTTEFNTQSLLKGKNVPVVETAANMNTITQGQKATAVGALSALQVNSKSVVGVESTAVVQSSTSVATGKVSGMTETAASTKGEKSFVTVANGITFQSDALGNTLNGKTITIQGGEGNDVGSSLSIDADGNYTFTIGTNGTGDSLATNRGTLYNELKTSIDNATFGSGQEISVLVPADTAEAVSSVATTGSLTGGVNEALGSYEFSITDAFEEGGDSVTIGGQTFKAVFNTTADASAGEFEANVAARSTTALDKDLSTLGAATSIKVTINGVDYTSGDLANGGAAFASNSALTTFIGNSADASGNKLSDVADVVLDSNNNLSIRAKGTQDSITIAYTGAAGDNTIAATKLGLAAGTTTRAESQAQSLATAIDQNSVLGGRFDAPAVTGSTIALTESANQATGVALADPTVAGSGTDNTLTITNSEGQNLNKVTIQQAAVVAAAAATSTDLEGAAGDTLTITAGAGVGSRANQVKFELVQNTSDSLNVSYKNGVVKISLANGTANKNDVANIESQLQSLGTKDGIDFSAWTVADAAGTWDGNNTGATITDGSSQMSGGVDAVALDELTVTSNGSDLTINLSGEKSSENTAAKIQSAVQNLGEYYYFNSNGDWTSVDYSKYTTKAGGNWDTDTLGNSLIVDEGTFVGGTQEVKGQYQFEISKSFVSGDKVEINGKVFTAVDSNALASKGQFNVGDGNISAQAAGLIDAINLSSLKDTYTATANAGVITLSENAATGTDLSASQLSVRATGTQGEFSVAQDSLLESGSKFIVDGEEISVSDKNTHVGYSNGTAIKVADTLAAQSQELADAINTNANLKDKYTASVDDKGTLILKQSENFTSDQGPSVSTKNSSQGDFTATFQIGANSGQSMTITVGDMRADALGISGDGSVGTIAAKNGTVASYVSVANVSDGTTNKNTQFALDVTTSDKASAAISVINDAIETVSSQRSQLGAYQNRLEHTINNLGTSSENLTAAESRIRDVDMAKEIMENTKNNILAQAAQAMLAQANQSTQGVLQLLR